jgi:DNA primase
MISQQQLDDLHSRVSIISFVTQHVNTLSAGDMAGKTKLTGPCPKCGGDDRFVVTDGAPRGVWFCNQCHPPQEGKRHDVIDLVKWLGIAPKFNEAFRYVNDWAGGAPVVQVKTTVKERKSVDNGWVAKKYMPPLRQNLTNAADYLEKRGIILDTAKAFGLGFEPNTKFNDGKAKAPAIALPWIDQDGTYSRVAYRFLETQIDLDGDDFRYKNMGALKWRKDALFGLQAWRDSDTLAIFEGEFNSMSAWQVKPWNVVSVGSMYMSDQQLERLRPLAGEHQKVLIWTDKPEKSSKIADAIQHPNVVKGKSPKGKDANDLLKMGLLADFLTHLEKQFKAAPVVEVKPWWVDAPLPSFGGREGAQKAAAAAIAASIAKHGR